MKRPKIISLICIIGYLSVVFTFPQVFSPAIKKLGILVPAIYGLITASHFIACVGLWYFKQWGVQLYLVTFLSRVLFFVILRDYTPLFFVNTILSLIFIVILLRFYRSMNPNL